MAASSAHKMTAACAVLVILLSTAAQPAMGVLPDIGSLSYLPGGIPYILTLDQLLFTLSKDKYCASYQQTCYQPCQSVCRLFGEKVLCDTIICNHSPAACRDNVKWTCTDICGKICSQLPLQPSN